MVISLATLALLGVTAVLMLLSTRRAQRLARQQICGMESVDVAQIDRPNNRGIPDLAPLPLF